MVASSTSNGDGLRAVLRISARADYAIRLVVALAARPGEVLPRELLAETEGLPVTFADHVLRQLRNGGLIQSRRGRHGGYWLARAPELISLADIVHVMGDSQIPPAQSHAEPAAWLSAVWTGLSDAVDAALADVSVATLRDARAAEPVHGA